MSVAFVLSCVSDYREGLTFYLVIYGNLWKPSFFTPIHITSYYSRLCVPIFQLQGGGMCPSGDFISFEIRF
jgi:hypothetical protein